MATVSLASSTIMGGRGLSRRRELTPETEECRVLLVGEPLDGFFLPLPLPLPEEDDRYMGSDSKGF